MTAEQIENRKKWVAALRSGKYQQGTGVLKRNDSYCCLGVACDISKLSEWIESRYDHGLFLYLGANYLIPTNVQKLFGITDNEAQELMTLNDCGTSFLNIANIIEKNNNRNT